MPVVQFQIKVGDIGPITKIRLHHDNTHDFPSLHLDWVIMSDVHTQEELMFYCDRWLATDEADGSLIREFAPSRPGEPVTPGKLMSSLIPTFKDLHYLLMQVRTHGPTLCP